MVFETRTLPVIALGLLASCNIFNTTGGLPFLITVNGAVTPAGARGSQIFLSGGNFGSVQGNSQVLFSNALGGLTVPGTIAQASDWSDNYIIITVPTGAFSGGMIVQTSNGTSSIKEFTVSPDVPNIPSTLFTPSAVSWTPSNSLPVGLSGNALVYARVRATGVDTGFVYSIGGADNTGTPTNDVEYAVVAADGSLGAWTPAGSTGLPAVAFHAAVAATPRNSFASSPGFLYVLGGATNSAGTIYRATLSATGTVGAWSSIGTLPAALHSLSAMVYLGSLYVVGGATSGNAPVATVYRTAIQIDGSIGAWQNQGSLPGPRARLGIGALGNYVYAIGGDSATLAPDDTVSSKATATVFYGKLQPGSRNITSWAATGPLQTPRSAHSVVIAGGSILVTGGLYSGRLTGSNEASYATITPADGTVGSFTVATGGTKLTSNLFNHAATGYLAGLSGSSPTFHVLVVGGDDVNSPGTKHVQTFTY